MMPIFPVISGSPEFVAIGKVSMSARELDTSGVETRQRRLLRAWHNREGGMQLVVEVGRHSEHAAKFRTQGATLRVRVRVRIHIRL